MSAGTCISAARSRQPVAILADSSAAVQPDPVRSRSLPKQIEESLEVAQRRRRTQDVELKTMDRSALLPCVPRISHHCCRWRCGLVELKTAPTLCYPALLEYHTNVS